MTGDAPALDELLGALAALLDRDTSPLGGGELAVARGACNRALERLRAVTAAAYGLDARVRLLADFTPADPSHAALIKLAADGAASLLRLLVRGAR